MIYFSVPLNSSEVSGILFSSLSSILAPLRSTLILFTDSSCQTQTQDKLLLLSSCPMSDLLSDRH